MAPLSKTGKLALCVATGTLAALTAAGPAAAATTEAGGGHGDRHTKGKVTAKHGLTLRDAPHKKAKKVGKVPHGKIVKIKCKVNGQWINGNPRWYLLASGKWAWASERHIKTLGHRHPHWC
ncbi:SH3 domain-containing protein [Streptomyces sp. URMC 123]|uniref:SH3 domain-containing protein n=1 Tax=Streptomyces sp. URMC 123 TaxID=3423403 RepID=UPI003F199C88